MPFLIFEDRANSSTRKVVLSLLSLNISFFFITPTGYMIYWAEPRRKSSGQIFDGALSKIVLASA